MSAVVEYRARIAHTAGIREFDPERDTAIQCAQRLSRYISDPASIRAYVVASFGRTGSPSIDAIAAMVVEHKRRAATFVPVEGEANAGELLHFAPRNVPHEVCERRATNGREPIKLMPGAKPVPLKDPLPRREDLHTAIDVIAAAAKACGVPGREVLGRARHKKVISARYLAMALLRARGNSLLVIGQRFGRDHATAQNACRQFFERELLRPEMLQRWEAMAPLKAVACRSYDELCAVVKVRQ